MSLVLKAHEQVYLSEQKRMIDASENLQLGQSGADALESNTGVALQAPTSNTGRLEEKPAATDLHSLGYDDFVSASESYEHFLSVDGKVVEVALRRGKNTAAHIDTLTLSMKEEVFCEKNDEEFDSLVFASAVSAQLVDILGYGVSAALKGRNGYQYAFSLGGESGAYGFVAFGGAQQRNSVCIHITGAGCISAKDGWEHRLYEFIENEAPYTKITRIDIAHDFMNGEYTAEQCFEDWKNGLFKNGRTSPKVERVGTDWDNHDDSGKTCYVGKGSRQFYAYEKGKQLGDKSSPWVRGELRLRNKDLLIPHDTLINAGDYLAGSFPALANILDKHIAPKKVELKEKEQEISVEHVLFHARNQASRAIAMLNHLGFDESEIIETLWNKASGLPARVDPERYDCNHVNIQYLHEFKHLPTYVQLANYEVEKTGALHRTFDEYLQLQRLDRLKKVFPTKEEVKENIRKGVYDYDEYLIRKNLTPHNILNPDF